MALDWRSHAVPLLLGLALAALVPPAAEAAEPAPPRCAEPIPDIYDRVSPAVVFISATAINPYQLSDRVTHTVGSGFIIDAAAGRILTSSHVVFGRQSIRVTLDDGTLLPAVLVGADPIFDLAVIEIPVPGGATLPVVTLGDSDAVALTMLALAAERTELGALRIGA
jgi:S1-C subfamily serine protease